MGPTGISSSSSWASPPTFLYNLLAAVIRALGDSKTPVYFLAISSVLNIALDLLLILYCHAGVAGAALATVISQGVSGLACLVFMVKRFPILHMTAEERRLDGRTCRTLCLMGIPMGLQYSITAIGSIVPPVRRQRPGQPLCGLGGGGDQSCSRSSAVPLTRWGPPWPPTAGQNVGQSNWTGWDGGSGPAPCWAWAMPCSPSPPSFSLPPDGPPLPQSRRGRP